MRSITVLLAVSAVIPVAACYVDTYGPPPVQASVQVQQPEPQPVTAQVDVNAGTDPNAQQPTDQGTDQVADTDPSAVSDFRDVLSPYGTWADDPQYGTVWFPNPQVVGGDFTPYTTAGHWVYDNDYTWVSDYDWGWAPFHYGRWFMAPGRGWGWIPGKEYAGAWVTWRNGDDGYGYIGWAPTPPSFYWRGGVAVNLPAPWFQPTFAYVDTGSLFQPTFRTNIIRDRARISVIESRTRLYAPSGSVVVGGNTRMMMRGPAPAHLGLNVATLPRAPAQNPGMVRAYQFSHQRGGQPVARTVTPTHPPLNEQRGPGMQGQQGQGRVEERGPAMQQGQQGQGRVEQRGPAMQQGNQGQQGQGRVEERGPAMQQGQGRVEERGPAMQQGQRGGAMPQPTATAVRRNPPPSETHERRR